MKHTISQQTKEEFLQWMKNLEDTDRHYNKLPNGNIYTQLRSDYRQITLDAILTEKFNNRTKLSGGASNQFVAFETPENQFVLIQPAIRREYDGWCNYDVNNGVYISKFNSKEDLKEYMKISYTFEWLHGSSIKSLVGLDPVEQAINNVNKISLENCEKVVVDAITKMNNLRDKFFPSKDAKNSLNNN